MTELIIKYAEPSGIADKTVIPSEVVGTLVRCKDCKRWKIDSHCDGYRSAEDFCSWGERREE